MTHTYRKRWTEEEIKQSILDVMKKTGIKTMPTKSEMIKATNSEALYNAIHVRGGLKLWAEKMGREIGHKKIAAETLVKRRTSSLGRYVRTHPEESAKSIAEKFKTSVQMVYYHRNKLEDESPDRPYTEATAFLIRKWYREYTTGANRSKRKTTSHEEAVLIIAGILDRSTENVEQALKPEYEEEAKEWELKATRESVVMRNNGGAHAARIVETGETFNSAKECAERLSVGISTVYWYISRGKATKEGYHIERAMLQDAKQRI